MIKLRRPLVFAEEVFETYTYTSNAFNVNFATDIFVTANRPFVAGQNWNVVIAPDVVVGSTSSLVPAAFTGVFPRILKVTVMGSILGAGGAGGRGGVEFGLKDGGKGGGGGGGAGVNAGSGGTASSPATAGGTGTSTAGGEDGAGSIDFTEQPEISETTGGHGGTALYIDMPIRLHILEGGKVWGGGGGGGGASGLGIQSLVNRWGGVGGSPGERGHKGGSGIDARYSDAGSGAEGGIAGFSVEQTLVHTVTIISVASGSLKGVYY